MPSGAQWKEAATPNGSEDAKNATAAWVERLRKSESPKLQQNPGLKAGQKVAKTMRKEKRKGKDHGEGWPVTKGSKGTGKGKRSGEGFERGNRQSWSRSRASETLTRGTKAAKSGKKGDAKS